jgi:hypothetical protein
VGPIDSSRLIRATGAAAFSYGGAGVSGVANRLRYPVGVREGVVSSSEVATRTSGRVVLGLGVACSPPRIGRAAARLDTREEGVTMLEVSVLLIVPELSTAVSLRKSRCKLALAWLGSGVSEGLLAVGVLLDAAASSANRARKRGVRAAWLLDPGVCLSELRGAGVAEGGDGEGGGGASKSRTEFSVLPRLS